MDIGVLKIKSTKKRDVTQGEDKSRIRTNPLPKIFTIARNFTLNLYREKMFKNMAQAQGICSFSLDTLKQLFRMKWVHLSFAKIPKS